jgi:hypothetical protein
MLDGQTAKINCARLKIFVPKAAKKENRKGANVRILIKYRRRRMISCSLIKSTSGPTNSGARTIRLIVL